MLSPPSAQPTSSKRSNWKSRNGDRADQAELTAKTDRHEREEGERKLLRKNLIARGEAAKDKLKVRAGELARLLEECFDVSSVSWTVHRGVCCLLMSKYIE